MQWKTEFSTSSFHRTLIAFLHFPSKHSQKYYQLIHKKLVNAYVVAAKSIAFTVNFDCYLIFTIKIFTNFEKPNVKTITLLHSTNTKFAIVTIQYFLNLINPPAPLHPSCSDLCYSVKLQAYNGLSEMCTMVYRYRNMAKRIFEN